MKNVKLVIEKAQEHDQKAFNDLFSHYWGYLYNFHLKKIGNKDLAEEISIITFARPLIAYQLSMINLNLKPGY